MRRKYLCEDVTKEKNRLAIDRPLQLCQKFLYDGHSKFKLLFQNVRSLNKHFFDIAADPNYGTSTQQKAQNVRLPYVKHALNVRHKTYVNGMYRAPYV